MKSFSGIPADLLDAVAYELDAIDYLRTTLHGHVEAPVGRTILDLGDLTPEGEQRRTVEAHVYCDVSGAAVHAALDRLRPLAFSATFKLQDMIAEWILRANGVFKWRFTEKLTGYDRLREASNLVEPEFFAARAVLSRAFWELYRFLEPFRGGVLHSGGVTLESDCTVTMNARNGSALRFTPTQQGSYMRAMCLISKVMGGQVHAGSFLENLIEADFVELQ